MLEKLITLVVQVVSDEFEAAQENNAIPFDWNIAGLDKSRPPLTRENCKSLLEPNQEHILRKVNALLK